MVPGVGSAGPISFLKATKDMTRPLLRCVRTLLGAAALLACSRTPAPESHEPDAGPPTGVVFRTPEGVDFAAVADEAVDKGALATTLFRAVSACPRAAAELEKGRLIELGFPVNGTSALEAPTSAGDEAQACLTKALTGATLKGAAPGRKITIQLGKRPVEGE